MKTKNLKNLLKAALLAAPVIVSCSKNEASSPEAGESARTVSLRMSLDSPSNDVKGTTAWTKEQEKAVVSWQVFVFNDDGSLDVAQYKTGGGSAELICTLGKKHVYALVNHDTDLTGSTDKESDLLALKSNLSSNIPGTSFVMFGEQNITVSTSTSATIKVDRICSKVYIDSITNSLSGSYGKITVKGIYIINAAGDAVLGNDKYIPATGGSWYNKKKYSASGISSVEAMLYDGGLSETIARGASTSTPHYFYCYPNLSTASGSESAWSPRCSRLVVETVIEGDSAERRYYSINLFGNSGAGVERNKYYHIKSLTIKHLGTLDPDKTVDSGTMTFSLQVTDWTEGFNKEVEI